MSKETSKGQTGRHKPITAADYKPTENQVESGIIDLCKAVGVVVLKFSQPHKSTQTRGIADLRLYYRLRGRSDIAWFEVKSPKGKQSVHQQMFQMLVEDHGERYEIGGLYEAIELLEEWGAVKIGSVQPKGEPWEVKRDPIR